MDINIFSIKCNLFTLLRLLNSNLNLNIIDGEIKFEEGILTFNHNVDSRIICIIKERYDKVKQALEKEDEEYIRKCYEKYLFSLPLGTEVKITLSLTAQEKIELIKHLKRSEFDSEVELGRLIEEK